MNDSKKTLVYGLGESGVSAIRALLDIGETEILAADAGDNERLRGVLCDLEVEGKLGAGPEVLEGVGRVVVSPACRHATPCSRLRRHAEYGSCRSSRSGSRCSGQTCGSWLLQGPTARRPSWICCATYWMPPACRTRSPETPGGRLPVALKKSVAPASWFWKSPLSSCTTGHEGKRTGFEVAALVNVRPDHLNWHASFEEYAEDKLRIFDGQDSEDLAIVSAADEIGLEALETIEAETLIVGEASTGVKDGELFLRGNV